MTLTDTSRHVLEDALIDALEQEQQLHAQLALTVKRIEHLRADLDILTEPTDPDEPVPFEVIDDPWASPMHVPFEADR